MIAACPAWRGSTLGRARAPENFGECACMGPHPGAPACACAMERVAEIDGIPFSVRHLKDQGVTELSMLPHSPRTTIYHLVANGGGFDLIEAKTQRVSRSEGPMA